MGKNSKPILAKELFKYGLGPFLIRLDQELTTNLIVAGK